MEKFSWYYEKEDLKLSPSFLDGIDRLTEDRYRRTGVRFILRLGSELGLRHEACATAAVFFQRFYMFHSFKNMPLFLTASCCLFLSGKVEETPKKCSDIVKKAQLILPAQQLESYLVNPLEEIMCLERILLKTIRFDMQINHPYKPLLQFAKRLIMETDKLNSLVQSAWAFINDSLSTTLCLEWEPEIIACSALYLSQKVLQLDISHWEGWTLNSKSWWECFVEGITPEVMDDVGQQLQNLYKKDNVHDDITLFLTVPKLRRLNSQSMLFEEMVKEKPQVIDLTGPEPDLSKDFHEAFLIPLPPRVPSSNFRVPNGVTSVGCPKQ